MLSIVSGLCWLPVCFLWRNVSLGLLPIFESFYHEWRLNFVICFFGICWDDHIGFVFPFVNVIYHTNFVLVEPSLHPRYKSHLIVISVFMCCWIRFASILVRILCLYSSGISAYSFLVVSFSVVWYPDNIGLIKWVWEYSPLLGFLEEFEKGQH